jgi:hypothetical protein
MEEVMPVTLEGWAGRTAQALDPREYLRKRKVAKPSSCKKESAPSGRLAHRKTALQWFSKAQFEDAVVRGLAVPVAVVSTEARFRELADEWSERTMHISSASDLINDTRYQQIIDLGWDVLPYLLDDLQKNKRFWFPALAAITGVRPFDPGDLSNPRRMIEAWVKWGRRKGLIV